MLQKSLTFNLSFHSKKYNKLPETPMLLSQQFADLRLRLKKSNQTKEKLNKNNASVIDDDDVHDETYDYKTVYFDGFCNDCIRIYTCGLIKYGNFSKLKQSEKSL